MRKRIIFLLIACWLMNVPGQATDSITADDYCSFLNTVATNDLYHFYEVDSSLSTGGNASIMRVGTPGNYHYGLINSSDASLFLISESDALQYCTWKVNAATTKETSSSFFAFTEQGADELEGNQRVLFDKEALYFLEPSLKEARHVDPFLKSNLFTFHLVSSEALAHETSGENVALDGLLDEVEEAIAAIGIIGAGGRPSESRSILPRSDYQRSERGTSATTALRVDSSSTPALFTEPAYLKEKEQIAHTLQQLIEGSQQAHAGTHYAGYYQEADHSWKEDQQAWEERTIAQHTLELKKKTLLQAEQLFATAVEERSKTDTQKTLLARISQVAGKAAMPLSFIPGPIPLGGIAHTVSEVTSRLNQALVEKDVVLSERAVARAAHEVELATRSAEAANEHAAMFRKKAQEAEEHARLLEIAARKDDMERLHPPVTSLNEDDWKEWATRLVQAGRGDSSSIENLTNHGLSDPLWADELVTQALSQRVEEQAQLAAEEKRKRLEPFEKAFQEASEALQTAQEIATAIAATATTAHQRFEAATQIYDYWKSELEEINGCLNELEKPENVRKPEAARAITLNKEKFSTTLTNFEKATNDLQACEEAVKEADAALALEESKALSLRNEATAAEETLLRNRERAALHQEKKPSQVILRLPRFSDAGIFTTEKLEGTEKAENTIFPPEVLSKTYETIGKALLKEKRGDQLQEKQEPAVTQRLLPGIREPNPEDLARWEASLRAEDFIEERNEVIANIKRRMPSHALSQANEEAETTATGLSAIREENDNESDEEPGSSLDGSIKPLLSRKQQRKGESSRASSMTIKTRSEKSQSSIGSFVSSVHSWSGSVASSIPASVASGATKLELKNLKKATRAINDMANQWAELVRKADAERVANGGTPYLDEEMLFEAWQESDTIAQAAWKKRCNIQEETLRTAAMATSWNANTIRWEARAEADRLLHDQEEAEVDLVSLAEQQKPLDLVWTSQYQNASEHLKAMEKVATEAQKKWTRLAEQEPSIQKAQSKEEKNNTLKKLRARDQAINALWERVQEDYYAEKDHEPRRKAQARLVQETSAYQFDLITEKISTMATCFAEADAASSQQQSAADALEKDAIAKYTEATLQEALKAAWEQIPGAVTAWEFRVAKAEKNYQVAQKKADTSKATGLEDSATEKKVAVRFAAIVEADRKALESLQQETKAFADIEASWKTELQEEERATFLKRLAAARAYSQGELASWHALPYQERELYNEAIAAANETVIDMLQSRLQEAWENTQEWHQKMTKAWRIFSKKNMEQITQKAIAELTQLKMQEDERKVAIRQAKICDFECQANQEENHLSIVGGSSAEDALKMLIALRSKIAERAAVEAKAFCDELEIAWTHKADVVQAGYNQSTYYIEHARSAWDQLAEAKRAELGKLPVDHHDLMIAATYDLIKAEEEKEAWREKKAEAEKMALATKNPLVLKMKAVFEVVRNAWEILRHHENMEHPESVLFATELIKNQAATVTDTDLDIHAYSALMAMSTTAKALEELTIAARNHARIRIGGGVGGAGAGVSAGTSITAVANGATGGFFVTGALTFGFGTGMIIATGGFGAIPIVFGGGYLYYKYRKRNNPAATPLLPPLAPRTTEAARAVISKAQEVIEAAAHETATTIWGADTAWCRDAIREAQELVNAITHTAIR